VNPTRFHRSSTREDRTTKCKHPARIRANPRGVRNGRSQRCINTWLLNSVTKYIIERCGSIGTMITRRFATASLITLVVTGSLVVWLATSQARGRQVGDVDWQLDRIPRTNEFVLTATNRSNRPVSVFLYPWSYEVRLYGSDGKLVSDQRSYEELVNVPAPRAGDFRTLQPGRSAPIRLCAYDKHGAIQIGNEIRAAECIGHIATEPKSASQPTNQPQTPVSWCHLDSTVRVPIQD
jgi:hypothetical protein